MNRWMHFTYDEVVAIRLALDHRLEEYPRTLWGDVSRQIIGEITDYEPTVRPSLIDELPRMPSPEWIRELLNSFGDEK